MRKYWYLIVLTTVCFLCAACSIIAGNEETVRDSKKYLCVDPYVEEYLENACVGLLMNKSDFNPDLAEYYYYYTNMYLGDPSFIIKLEYHFDSPTLFQKEISRIDTIAQEKYADGNQVLYSGNSPSKDIEQYLNKEINDGRCYLFEFAFVDQSSMTISYLTTLVQENQSQADIVLRFLELWDSRTGDGLREPFRGQGDGLRKTGDGTVSYVAEVT